MPVAWLTVLVERRSPRGLPQGEDLLAQGAVDRIAQREGDPCLTTSEGEVVARPRAVRAREDLPVKSALGSCSRASSSTPQVIRGVVRAGVAGPQHAGPHLPSAAGKQRVKAEPASPAFHARSRARARARWTPRSPPADVREAPRRLRRSARHHRQIAQNAAGIVNGAALLLGAPPLAAS